MEDEMVGWHQQFNGHEFEQTPGECGGQGSQACCSPWSCRVGHDLVTEQQCHSKIPCAAKPGANKSQINNFFKRGIGCCTCILSHSVVSNSVRPHRRQPNRLLCPWDSPGKNTGESHGQRSLAGYSPWGCKESDTTEQLTHTHTYCHIPSSKLRWSC